MGASPRTVRWRIVRVVVGPTLIGAIGGLIATWWTGSMVQSVVAVDVRSPWQYGAALLLMLAAALLAGWLPARQAGRIDPATALRES